MTNMQRSDLPFGSEFSPSQIVLPDLLEIIDGQPGRLARAGSGHPRNGISPATPKAATGEEASYNRGKLANNCKLGLIAYGIIERAGSFTDFGRHLHDIRKDEPALYRDWPGTFC